MCGGEREIDMHNMTELMRAASATHVRDNKPATVAEARECWRTARARVLHWQTALEAAGGDLAPELLDAIHDASPRTEGLCWTAEEWSILLALAAEEGRKQWCGS